MKYLLGLFYLCANIVRIVTFLPSNIHLSGCLGFCREEEWEIHPLQEQVL